jgi:hypothetical protein
VGFDFFSFVGDGWLLYVKDIAMKLTGCCSLILLFFVVIYSSQMESNTPFVVLENYAVFSGKIIGVHCPDCDTTYDTIPIRIQLDTINGSEQQNRINKYNLKHHDMILKLCMPFNDSLMLKQQINCNPCELIVKPLSNLNLPPKIDTVIISTYKTGTRISSIPVKNVDSGCIGNMVLCGGIIGISPGSPNKASMYYNNAGHLHFSHHITPEQNYSFNKSITFNSQLVSTNKNNLDFDFELGKELIFLMKEDSLKKRIERVNNLMYHPYYLRDPSGFAKMVNYNLKDLQEKKRNRIIDEQRAISHFKINDQ